MWKFLVSLVIFRSINIANPSSKGLEPRVFYGGAISGDRGGPRVKVLRLHEQFPQDQKSFNLVYALSNFPYLSKWSLKLLQEAKIPVVLNQNGVYFPGWYGDGWKEKNLDNADIYQACQYVFWQSEFARDSSRKFLSNIDPRGEILYNSVDLSLFSPNTQITSKNEFVFLVAGNFNWGNFYQIETALRAFVNIKNRKSFKIYFAGLADPLMRATSKLAYELSIFESVRLIGRFTQAEGAKLMREVDVYLALKFMDTCPNLVIEALASGVPVIFSNSGGTRELVDNACGIGAEIKGDWNSIPSGPDPHLLSKLMQEIVPNRKVMGQAARTRAEEMFNLRHWHERHKVIFDMLLAERSK